MPHPYHLITTYNLFETGQFSHDSHQKTCFKRVYNIFYCKERITRHAKYLLQPDFVHNRNRLPEKMFPPETYSQTENFSHQTHFKPETIGGNNFFVVRQKTLEPTTKENFRRNLMTLSAFAYEFIDWKKCLQFKEHSSTPWKHKTQGNCAHGSAKNLPDYAEFRMFLQNMASNLLSDCFLGCSWTKLFKELEKIVALQM